MITIIAGPRSINDISIVEKAIAASGFTITKVVSGTAKGVDKLGERWAIKNDILVELMPADWDKYGKSAGYKRNLAMAEVSEALIAIWDGQSSGAKHMINIARLQKLPTFIFNINLLNE